MTTNSRPGRQRNVDRDAVFALALERAHLPPNPQPAVDAARTTAKLLSRLGRVRPLPDQVPPT